MIKKNSDILIGILNGGKSERMGTHKSLIKINGEITISEKIFNHAKTISENVFFLGNSPLPEKIINPVILEDKYCKGPLGALSAISDFKCRGCILWAVDMPLLTENDIELLLSFSSDLTEPVIPFNSTENIYECLFAYYPHNLMKKISKKAKTGKYKSIQYILKELKVKGNCKLYDKLEEKLKSWNYPIDIIL